eukprot:gene10895-2970_t
MDYGQEQRITISPNPRKPISSSVSPKSKKPKKTDGIAVDYISSPLSISEMRARRERSVSGHRQRRQFSLDEIDALEQGLHMYGVGAWSLIANCFAGRFQERTAVDLKDKFRNLKRHLWADHDFPTASELNKKRNEQIAEEIIARAADIDSETSNNEGSPSQATGSINSKSTYHCNSPRHPPDEERSKIESNTSKEKESKDNSSTERKLSTQKDTASVQNTPTKTLSKHEQEKTGTRSQVRTRARTRAKIMLSSK